MACGRSASERFRDLPVPPCVLHVPDPLAAAEPVFGIENAGKGLCGATQHV
jgi:hypothetical protein